MVFENNSGAMDESDFWEDIIKSHKENPQEWIDSFLNGLAPAPDYLSKFINHNLCAEEAKVLDVGCGPFGGIQANGIVDVKVRLHYVDPLASEYKNLLNRYGLSSVEITEGVAEALDKIYPDSYFDFINADNSLDHCQDPRQAICSIIRVLKPGGVCRIKVFVNEGLYTGYSGFHQWNFTELSDKVVMWRDSEIFFLEESTKYSPYSFMKTTETTGVGDNRETLVILIQKHGDVIEQESHIEDIALIYHYPLIGAVSVYPESRFDISHNLFIHSIKGSDFSPVSKSARFGRVPYVLRYPPGSEYVSVGQYMNSGSESSNIWMHEINL